MKKPNQDESALSKNTNMFFVVKQSEERTNDVAQVKHLLPGQGAGIFQHGHDPTFQPPQDLNGALKSVHRIDGLSVTNSIKLNASSK